MTRLLCGKRLLLLGANAESIPIVEAAQRMGVFVIVTDNIIQSPAKKVADKYFDIDGKNIEKLLKLISDENVDGILVGAADPLVPIYYELCQRIGFPCYVAKEHLDFFTNKQMFKIKMEKAGIPTVREYYAGKYLEEIKNASLVFPLIIKPEIGRGGKGVCLCKTKNELENAFFIARENSDNGRVIVEEYMNCTDVTVNYMFFEGIPRLLLISDRLVLKKDGQISPVTYGNIYPSVFTEKFIKEHHNRFCILFKQMGIQYGILEMQMFVKDGKFYPYDPACILGGELSGKVFSKLLQTNLIEHFIEYSLTGKMSEYKIDALEGYLPEGKCAASIWLLLLPGTIGKIYGIDKVIMSSSVLGYIWRLKEGDTVTEEMYQTEKSTLARLWISASSKDDLVNIINEIRNEIKVYDQNGKNMLYDGSIIL